MAGFRIDAPSGTVIFNDDGRIVDAAGIITDMALRGNLFQPRYGITMEFVEDDRDSLYWATMTVMNERHGEDDIAVDFDGMEEPVLEYEAPRGVVF